MKLLSIERSRKKNSQQIHNSHFGGKQSARKKETNKSKSFLYSIYRKVVFNLFDVDLQVVFTRARKVIIIISSLL